MGLIKLLKKYIRNNSNLYSRILNIGSLVFSKVISEKKNNREILECYLPSLKMRTYIGENNIRKKEYDLQIIIPVYNVEKYLDECIESVINQSTKYKVLIMIINDGSTDSSREILEKYKKYKNIKIIDQENKGLSIARNVGIKNMYAHYIMFLDSDDILMSGAIDLLLDHGYRGNFDIVEGEYIKFVKLSELQNIKDTKLEINCYEGLSTDNLLTGFAWMKIFKSEIFKNIQFPENFWFEDTICSLLIFSREYRICKINKVIYGYRKNINSITSISKMSKRILETYYLTEDLIINGLNQYNIKKNQYLYLQFLHQIRLNYQRTKKCPEEVKRAIFFESKKLYYNYFIEYKPHVNGKMSYDTLLEKAFENNDYGSYRYICRYGDYRK